MTRGRAHLAIYRRMLRLYPPAFRHEYGADLVLLFADQLQDEAAARVWARTVRDLAVSVPVLRLEAHMTRSPAPVVTAVSGVIAATAGLLVVTIGSGPAAPAFLLVAVIAALVAVWSWRASRSLRPDGMRELSWWKILVAGPALAGLTFVAMAVPWPDAVDLGDNAYWLVFISFLTSVTLAGTGLLLGVVALADRRRATPAP